MQSDVTTTRDDAPGGGRDGPAPDALPVSSRGGGARAIAAAGVAADAETGAAAALGAAANGADAEIRAKRPSSSMSGVLSSFALPYLLLPLSAPTYAGSVARENELLERLQGFRPKTPHQ